MNLSFRRAVRPLLATAGLAAALGASGCIQITDEDTDQDQIIGDVVVTTYQCVDNPIFSGVRGDKSDSCDAVGDFGVIIGLPGGLPGPLSAEQKQQLAAERRADARRVVRGGADEDVQLLLAYRIPTTSKAPESFTATGTADNVGRPSRGSAGEANRTTTYRASSSYAAELEEREPTDEDMKWVGYISDRETADDGEVPRWSSKVRFTLPATEAGQPYRGPFPYSTVVGYRDSETINGDEDREVVCQSSDNTTCIADSSPDEESSEENRGSGPLPLGEIATRDLAIINQAGPVNITAGQGGDVPFIVRYAGVQSPVPFNLAATTSLGGATAAPAFATFPATTNQENVLQVRVNVPATAPGGLQTVELVASLPNGQSRRATAQFNVVPAVTTTAAQVIATPAKTCASRRSFSIRLRQRRRDPLVSAVVRVNGKKVKTVKKNRITAPVKLTGLPKGRFTVKITAKTRSGKTVTGTRRYRTCAPKLKGGIPEL
jgi:hypothetical protein